MINGAHVVIYSRNPEADRAFLRDVFQLPHVDVGEGWLIFGLPPAEVAVHPSQSNDIHEFYLLCENIEALIVALNERGGTCEPIQDLGWGRLTQLRLPGGGKVGIYEPRHARPQAVTPRQAAARKTKKK